MKDEIIKFETAKFAKEKGFDLECIYYWSIHHAGIKRPVLSPSFSGRKQNWNGEDYTKEAHAAPTQSLLQRWLREEHNIHRGAQPIIHNDLKNRPSYYRATRNDCSMHELGRFESYELALEDGLFEALKLIKP